MLQESYRETNQLGASSIAKENKLTNLTNKYCVFGEVNPPRLGGLHSPPLQRMSTRCSSREVRIRVPYCLWSILVGEPSQPKKGEKGHLGDPVHPTTLTAQMPARTPRGVQKHVAAISPRERSERMRRLIRWDTLRCAGSKVEWACVDRCPFKVNRWPWWLIKPPGRPGPTKATKKDTYACVLEGTICIVGSREAKSKKDTSYRKWVDSTILFRE